MLCKEERGSRGTILTRRFSIERDTMLTEKIVCKERVGGEGTILAIEKKPGLSKNVKRKK